MEKKLNYELDANVVNYILGALDKVQIAWVQSAQDLIAVTNLLKNPLNADDLEKEQLEELKLKHEKKSK